MSLHKAQCAHSAQKMKTISTTAQPAPAASKKLATIDNLLSIAAGARERGRYYT